MAEANPLTALLRAHHVGETGALEELMSELHPWLHGYVHKQMGPRIRAADESLDIVQDVLLRIFKQGPAFLPETDQQLKAIVATMAMNRLRDRHDWLDVRGGASHEVTHIGHSSTPSRGAMRSEEQRFLELGLALLDPNDALVLRERDWEQLEFAELGLRRDIKPDAARQRYNTAVRRLGALVRKLAAGDLDDLLPDDAPPET